MITFCYRKDLEKSMKGIFEINKTFLPFYTHYLNINTFRKAKFESCFQKYKINQRNSSFVLLRIINPKYLIQFKTNHGSKLFYYFLVPFLCPQIIYLTLKWILFNSRVPKVGNRSQWPNSSQLRTTQSAFILIGSAAISCFVGTDKKLSQFFSFNFQTFHIKFVIVNLFLLRLEY